MDRRQFITGSLAAAALTQLPSLVRASNQVVGFTALKDFGNGKMWIHPTYDLCVVNAAYQVEEPVCVYEVLFDPREAAPLPPNWKITTRDCGDEQTFTVKSLGVTSPHYVAPGSAAWALQQMEAGHTVQWQSGQVKYRLEDGRLLIWTREAPQWHDATYEGWQGLWGGSKRKGGVWVRES